MEVTSEQTFNPVSVDSRLFLMSWVAQQIDLTSGQSSKIEFTSGVKRFFDVGKRVIISLGLFLLASYVFYTIKGETTFLNLDLKAAFVEI